MNYKYSASAEHCVCTMGTSTACEILARRNFLIDWVIWFELEKVVHTINNGVV